jgi:type IV pilus assembly protein PilF
MRPSSILLLLSLTLWLAACANTQEREMKKNAAEANFKLGIGYMQSGRFEVATEKLLKSLQFDDKNPEAHNALAVLYEEIREYGPAETHYKQAIDLKPDYTLAKLNYARLLCTHQPARMAEGEGEFQKIATDPANAGATAADAYVGLAWCARQRNDVAQTETWLRKALESNSSNAPALYELAQISQSQNKTLSARAFLQRYHAQTRPTPPSLALGVRIENAPNGDPQLRQEYAKLLRSQFPNTDETRRLNKPE